jgi:dTDP-glucose 4,6-dehydratase
MVFGKSMMRSLVTGGVGFLGSHLCDKLLAEGHQVVCLDNLITGDIININHLQGNPKFNFVHYDVTNYLDIEGKIDFIFHFASPASPIDYLKFPIQTLKVGSLGTHKTLGLARSKSSRFLLASTSEVYGDPLIHPQSEGYWGNVNPVGPRGVYDEAKRFAEAMTMAYHRYHKIDTRIARIFNTYGERMRLNDGRVIPTFLSQALNNKDVTVFGNGLQTRSICYVSDLIDGIYRLMISDYDEPMNIGNPEEITILDLAKEIIQITGSCSRIVYEPLPQDDPKVRQPDISKAKELLKWDPQVKRCEGLKKTMEYFKVKLGLQ